MFFFPFRYFFFKFLSSIQSFTEILKSRFCGVLVRPGIYPWTYEFSESYFDKMHTCMVYICWKNFSYLLAVAKHSAAFTNKHIRVFGIIILKFHDLWQSWDSACVPSLWLLSFSLVQLKYCWSSMVVLCFVHVKLGKGVKILFNSWSLNNGNVREGKKTAISFSGFVESICFVSYSLVVIICITTTSSKMQHWVLDGVYLI